MLWTAHKRMPLQVPSTFEHLKINYRLISPPCGFLLANLISRKHEEIGAASDVHPQSLGRAAGIGSDVSRGRICAPLLLLRHTKDAFDVVQ